MNQPASSATDSSLALGIDIGGTSIKAAVIGGKSEWTQRSAVYERPDREQLLRVLREAIERCSPDVRSRVTVAGICTPGLVDPNTGVIQRAVNVPGLEGWSPDAVVREGLRDLLPELARVHACTDAHAAAHDFAITHAPAGRLLAISMGTGIGACVLDPVVMGQGVEWRSLSVSGRGPGHIGQIDVSIEGAEDVPVGADGGRGSLEAYMGLRALKARFGGKLSEVELGRLDPTAPPLAALVKALRICHAIYRPQCVALLGGVGIRLQPIAGWLSAAVGTGLTGLAREGWSLKCGSSDFHAALGAARLAMAECE